MSTLSVCYGGLQPFVAESNEEASRLVLIKASFTASEHFDIENTLFLLV